MKYKLSFMLWLPVIYPGIAFLLLSENKYPKFIGFTLALCFALFLLSKYFVQLQNSGFLKNILISTVIVSGSIIFALLSNQTAGVVLFLCVPCFIISLLLLFKSNAAKTFIGTCETGI